MQKHEEIKKESLPIVESATAKGTRLAYLQGAERMHRIYQNIPVAEKLSLLNRKVCKGRHVFSGYHFVI